MLDVRKRERVVCQRHSGICDPSCKIRDISQTAFERDTHTTTDLERVLGVKCCDAKIRVTFSHRDPDPRKDRRSSSL